MEEHNCYLDYLLESLAWRRLTNQKQLEKCDIAIQNSTSKIERFYQQIIDYATDNPPTDYLESITVFWESESGNINNIEYSYSGRIEDPPFIAMHIFDSESA